MRFPLYTDADIHGPVVEALKQAGWDVLRAIDALPEGTKDPIHFERAAQENRVLLTNDRRMEPIAHAWLAEGRAFRGLICWPRSHERRRLRRGLRGAGRTGRPLSGLSDHSPPGQAVTERFIKVDLRSRCLVIGSRRSTGADRAEPRGACRGD